MPNPGRKQPANSVAEELSEASLKLVWPSSGPCVTVRADALLLWHFILATLPMQTNCVFGHPAGSKVH